MGDEIGELFLFSDFRSRSATKSFLQDICMVADENSTDSGGGFHVKDTIWQPSQEAIKAHTESSPKQLSSI